MGQTLLFPDPKPLDQRLGRRFFKTAPQRTGVYLMKDADDRVLYVGKARNLKQRLNHYRLANPDRMPRRHLRLVREVTRIEFQFCASEAAALERESKLLRSLRPRFNRAGVWPTKTRFIVWRVSESTLEMGVVQAPAAGWQRFGPLNSTAHGLYQAFTRLLWLAFNGESSMAELPAGWGTGRLPDVVALQCGSEMAAVLAVLDQFFWKDPGDFLGWLGARLGGRTHAFERAVIAADLELLRNFSGKQRQRDTAGGQMALL